MKYLWAAKLELFFVLCQMPQWQGGMKGNSKVLARRVFSRPMDAHFWKKHKENSPNLSYVYRKTLILDGQLSMSG